jgi:hypothetical protein
LDSDSQYWFRAGLGLALMLAGLGLLVLCIVKLASIGTCADGGAYVSARPCPAGTEYWAFGCFGAVVLFLAGLWVFSTRGGRGVKPGLASSDVAAAPDWASISGGNRGAAWSYSAPPKRDPSAEPANGDRIARLERLQRLRQDGVLSESEFEVEKAKILSGL